MSCSIGYPATSIGTVIGNSRIYVGLCFELSIAIFVAQPQKHNGRKSTNAKDFMALNAA
jgi:hypothetical protein